MFDTALIESAHPVSDGRRARSLPLAIGFHAAVIGTLVVSTLWSTGEAPEPTIPLIFPAPPAASPPPPPVGPDTGRRAIAPAPPQTRLEAPITSIPELPTVSAVEHPAEETPVGESGHEGGPIGERAGVFGGTGDKPSAFPGPEGGSEILKPGVNGVVAPRLIQRVEPSYPEAMRLARIEGKVQLQAVITASGAVDEVRVVGSVNPILDAAAVAAVKRWIYEPATRNGRRVAVYLEVSVTFSLKS